MSSEIYVTSEKDSYAPGEIIKGTISWNCSKAPTNIIISLGWKTEGRGTCDKGTIFEEKIPCSRQEGERTFEIKIPEECPPSYSGQLISILWGLKASADISWARDPKAVHPIVISKLGQAYRPPSS